MCKEVTRPFTMRKSKLPKMDWTVFKLVRKMQIIQQRNITYSYQTGKNVNNTNIYWLWAAGIRVLSHIAVKLNYYSLLEKKLHIQFLKIMCSLISVLLLGILFHRHRKASVYKDVYMCVFTKQSKSPAIRKRLTKLWVFHTVDYYKTTKKNELELYWVVNSEIPWCVFKWKKKTRMYTIF